MSCRGSFISENKAVLIYTLEWSILSLTLGCLQNNTLLILGFLRQWEHESKTNKFYTKTKWDHWTGKWRPRVWLTPPLILEKVYLIFDAKTVTLAFWSQFTNFLFAFSAIGAAILVIVLVPAKMRINYQGQRFIKITYPFKNWQIREN